MNASQPKLRWGILGAAEIARKNWKAIHNSGNGIVAAVASRDLEKSRRFIAACQREAPFESPPSALGTYEALLASKDIEAVYMPLPTGLRKDWVIRAAAAGKHVVCEKPCATSVANLREMQEACRRHGVQFMDGVMFMHSRRLEAIREVLDEGAIGAVKRMASGFSFGAPPEFFTGNIRSHGALEPDGCVGDLGWYCLRFFLWALGGRPPRGVTGRILSQADRRDGAAPVPTEFSGELLFEDGISAAFYCSFVTELQQWTHVSGTKGSLCVSDFVLPNRGNQLSFEVTNPVYSIRGCDFEMEPHHRLINVEEHSHGHANAQETHLFRNFADQIRSGRLNESWPEIALQTQRVMEACLTSARSGGQVMDLKGS